MGEFDGRIFITTVRDVYYLYPVPLEKQVTGVVYLFNQPIYTCVKTYPNTLGTVCVLTINIFLEWLV